MAAHTKKDVLEISRYIRDAPELQILATGEVQLKTQPPQTGQAATRWEDDVKNYLAKKSNRKSPHHGDHDPTHGTNWPQTGIKPRTQRR